MELLCFDLTQKLSEEKSYSRAPLSRNEDCTLNSLTSAKHSPCLASLSLERINIFWRVKQMILFSKYMLTWGLERRNTNSD